MACHRLADLEEQKEILTEQIARLQKQDEERKRLEEKIPRLREDAERSRTELEDVERQRAAGAAERKAALEAVRAAAKNLSFASRQEAAAHIDRMKEQKAAAEEALRLAEETWRGYQKVYEDSRAVIEAVKKQLSQGGDECSEVESAGMDVSELTGRKDRIVQEKNRLAEALTSVQTRMRGNQTAAQEIQKQRASISETEKNWSRVKTLSNTANGNLSGREKIMLETYVQTTYFDRIIRRANLRLMKMTNGQYDLIRRKTADNQRSQSGLELDVIDHYNDTVRSVNTLSGGESFKASLSLALGLSDEIQSSAGGIRLDTMFIDEGFGSLDEESLRQALRVLAELSGGDRTVGIISHVAELKTSIDRQIIVSKERSGGSTVRIQV